MKKKKYEYHYKYPSREKQSVLKKALVLIALILVCTALIVYAYVAYTKTGTIIPTAELFDGRPTISFVDVGQGDCTLITYRGDSVLVDSGPKSYATETADYVRLYAPNIDYFIVTHPHEDHMGGAEEILKQTHVENLVITDVSVNEEFYKKALSRAKKTNTNVIRLSEETSFDTDKGAIHIDILDAFGLDYDGYNDASLITKVTVGSTTLLIPGDAEKDEEALLMWRIPDQLDSDILKVAHHGSSTSSSEKFLEAVSPEICVISCGKNNSYGHPSADVAQRLKDAGAKVYRTDRLGTIVLRGEK